MRPDSKPSGGGLNTPVFGTRPPPLVAPRVDCGYSGGFGARSDRVPRVASLLNRFASDEEQRAYRDVTLLLIGLLELGQ